MGEWATAERRDTQALVSIVSGRPRLIFRLFDTFARSGRSARRRLAPVCSIKGLRQ
jgi:hypothetical protein